MPEKFKEAQGQERVRFTEGEIETAKRGIEILSGRLDELLEKQDKEGLTDREKKEMDLIFNNVRPLIEIVQGKVPWEFTGKKPEEIN